MAKCTHCSAPLPKNGIICEYCGTRNDIDLTEIKKVVQSNMSHMLWCPVCHTHMSTINISKKSPLHVERCSKCFGIFFDKNELELMIEETLKGDREFNFIKLSQILQNPRFTNNIVYRKCPVCKKTMQRKNFMKRSGVVTDVCREHGIWLDSGELRHIMEWLKVGGEERIQKEKKHHLPPTPPYIEDINLFTILSNFLTAIFTSLK